MCNLSIPNETKGRKALFFLTGCDVNTSMRINEIITEGFNLQNTIAAVSSDIGNNITDTFDALKKSADNWMGGHDSLKGWGFVSGGVETRVWWDKIWDPLTNPKKGSNKPNLGLQGELYDLSKQAGKHGRILADLLNDMITDRGNFVRLSRNLPPILIAIGQDHGHENLVSRAKKWQEELRDFEKWLAEIESAGPKITTVRKGKSGEPSKIQEPQPQVKKLPSAIPGQNAAVEKIVNDILRNLPAGVAGDIRQAIAKSSNKLLALQAELSKKNIKV